MRLLMRMPKIPSSGILVRKIYKDEIDPEKRSKSGSMSRLDHTGYIYKWNKNNGEQHTI